MRYNYKEIHIGKIIESRINELEIEEERILRFLKISKKALQSLMTTKTIDSELLLKISKLLEYDFFRIYSQHLILYAPAGYNNLTSSNKAERRTPVFRKSVYTPEIILFIVKLIETGQKTAAQVMTEYRIPKTTLYTWISKHRIKQT